MWRAEQGNPYPHGTGRELVTVARRGRVRFQTGRNRVSPRVAARNQAKMKKRDEQQPRDKPSDNRSDSLETDGNGA